MTTTVLMSALDPTVRASILQTLTSLELQEIVGFADTKQNLAKRIAEFPQYYELIELTIIWHEPI